LGEPRQHLEVDCDSLNFNGIWSPHSSSVDGVLAVLTSDNLLIISPVKGIINFLELADIGAIAWSDSVSSDSHTIMLAVGATLVVKSVTSDWPTLLQTDAIFPTANEDTILSESIS
jgi:hypothetical protein